MDFSHFHAHNPQPQLHPQPLPRTRTHDTAHHQQSNQQPQHHLRHRQEENPPSKRRRSNSLNPPPSNASEPSTQPPATQWPTHLRQPPSTVERPFTSYVPRSVSPDQASRVSATSSLSTTAPQLRKKPKSNSIKNNDLRRTASSTIPKSPSLPTLQPHAQTRRDSSPSAAALNGNSGLTVTRTNSGTSQHQSPSQKRPPASHSSYGVETICGPPPSYSTQRTLSQERIKKVDRNTQLRMQTQSFDQGIALDDTYDEPLRKTEGASSLNQSSPETADTHSIKTPTEMDGAADVKVRGEHPSSVDEEGKASSSDERKSEDLFLNIARVDASRPTPIKTEKRRSRMSIPFLPSHRVSQSTRSSPLQVQSEFNHAFTPHAEVTSLHSKHASLGGQFPVSLSSRGYLVESNRFRDYPPEPKYDHEPNNGGGYTSGLRRASTTHAETNRLAHRSSAGFRASRLVSESTQPEQPRTGDNIATESTVSTAAPSTVWDELDDLKSRIRKLELTGKLPPSSAAAMASTERPRTATTAATTMSTSPNHKSSEPNLQSTNESVFPSIHPLLHDALDNARAVLSSDVYQKLQATAQDALQLATMMNTELGGGAVLGKPLSNEKLLKRRTESMCRGLTELAIALAAEAKPTQAAVRPVSRDHSLPPNSMLRGRRYSNEPADRGQASARIQSRLETRRTSMHLAQHGTGYSSPEHNMYHSPGAASQPPDSRMNRTSTLLRKRGQGSFDGANDHLDLSPSIRPGSRAMTDVGGYRHVPKDSRHAMQSSREYTRQHPLPTPQEQAAATAMIDTSFTPGASAGFTSRRTHSSAIHRTGTQERSPVTPREAWDRMSLDLGDGQSPDVMSETGAHGRMGSSRRSLGFASRIGSSVGSRLRAVRAERNSREDLDSRGYKSMSPSAHDDHTTLPATVDMYQAGHEGNRR